MVKKMKSKPRNYIYYMTESCLTSMESSSDEQQILEDAAFHLILLRNSLQQSSHSVCINEYDSGSRFHDDCSLAGFKMTMMMMEKLDYGVKGIMNHTENNKEENSSSSFSSSSSASIKSGISMEEVVDEDERVVRRSHRHRMRSIVDIYSVTRPL
ncbi:hypothetical protein R6Q59_020673 [Mikania micrantha]